MVTPVGGAQPAPAAILSNDQPSAPTTTTMGDTQRAPTEGAEGAPSNGGSTAPVVGPRSSTQVAGESARPGGTTLDELRTYLEFLRKFVNSTTILLYRESPGQVARLVRIIIHASADRNGPNSSQTFMQRAQRMRVNAAERITWAERDLQQAQASPQLARYMRDIIPVDIAKMKHVLKVLRVTKAGVNVALRRTGPSVSSRTNSRSSAVAEASLLVAISRRAQLGGRAERAPVSLSGGVARGRIARANPPNTRLTRAISNIARETVAASVLRGTVNAPLAVPAAATGEEALHAALPRGGGWANATAELVERFARGPVALVDHSQYHAVHATANFVPIAGFPAIAFSGDAPPSQEQVANAMAGMFGWFSNNES